MPPAGTAAARGGTVVGMRSIGQFSLWLAEQGGIAHTTVARESGFTTHGIRCAVATGAAERVRRSWLASPNCDWSLRRAALSGGRVTCLTQAERAGLWTPAHDALHVAVPPTASRVDDAGLRLHWSRGPAPVATHALEDPIINVLFHVARCVPLGDALSVWESAIRKRLIDPQVLSRVRWRSERARRIGDLASELSDSGLETRFATLMRSIGVEIRQQVWLDDHPVDALIGRHLVVQLDGFAHHQGADRRRDLRADARLTLRGYTVLRFDFQQLLFDPEYVISTIAAAIAQGLHL